MRRSTSVGKHISNRRGKRAAGAKKRDKAADDHVSTGELSEE